MRMKRNKENIKNPNWRKRWLEIVKYDQDWDWRYFMRIIMRKLLLIRNRWTDPELVNVCYEDRIKMVDRIQRLLSLGHSICCETTDEWDECQRILDQHGRYVETKTFVDGKNTMVWHLEWEPKDGDPDYWKNEYYRLLRAGDARHQENVKEFFAGLGDIMLELWD